MGKEMPPTLAISTPTVPMAEASGGGFGLGRTPALTAGKRIGLPVAGHRIAYRESDSEWAQILRNLRSGNRGRGGFTSTGGVGLVSIGLPAIDFISSIRFNLRSNNSAKLCSLTTAVTANLGTSCGSAATAHLILTGNGMDGLR